MARTAAALHGPTETELKLAIGRAAAERLPRHPVVLAHKRTRARSERLVATYYDTADGMLAAAGIALRVRNEGGRFVQTVKGPAEAAGGGGLSTRPEYQWSVASAAPDPALFVGTPYRRTLAKARKAGLVARFVTDYQRRTIPLAFPDSTFALLAIDVGEVRTGDGANVASATIAEIELELEAGEAMRLYEFAHALAEDVPLAIEPLSKAQRGYLLRVRQPAAPKSAVDPELDRRATARAAFAGIIGACLAQIEGNAAGVVAAEDPEWIHQIRIGVRRLRAALSLMRRALPAPIVEPLRVELRWLAGVLGPARDGDVFTLETLPAFRRAIRRGAAASALATPMRSLAARAANRRRDARVVARAAIASPRFLRVLLAAGQLAAQLRGTQPLGKLDAPARDFARRILKRRHRRVCAMGVGIADAPPNARHAVRLAAKNLRYATEFFAPLFARKRARAYRGALAALQDELGAWNDTAVAAELAGELSGATSAAAAAFGGWAAARGAARHGQLQAAWDNFVAADPFWSGA